ncbi:MAG: VWA domain-containing protein [Ignavibacteriales bacterium]|nr:VWA domain-containing protein [Ignavibacteriales bacterium]
MRFIYAQWTAQSQTDEQRLESLTSLFSYLTIQTSGDVEEALEWLKQVAQQYGIFDENLTLEDLINKLKELGIIEEVDGIKILTTKGVQKIRQDALKQIFTSLKKAPGGNHETPHTGTGVDRLSETKKWIFGDMPTNIDLTSTLTNAFKRDGIDDFRLQEEDLEVYETEHQTNCATVLMLDISHSMILYGEDRITPAKQVALALAELISVKFPRDYLALVVFGDEAKVVSMAELPFLNVGPYHTNTRAGLQLARSLLRRCGNINKQIFMVTDGKPSAIFDDAGRLYKNSFGLDPRIVNKTLDEAVQCRREKVTVSTFMVAQDPYLINFVEEFTKANHGRAYYSSLNNLGEFIFVDYLKNRRKRIQSGR